MYRDSIAARCVQLTRAVVDGLSTCMQCVAFWTAVFLPLVYVPLLLGGDSVTGGLSFLWKLIALNIAAVVVGYRYDGALRRFER